jgi:phosphoribosylglycinamide formyltransferase 1
MPIDMMNSSNIVIFASGGGSNAEKIIQYFQSHSHIKVQAIVCNNAQAGIVEKAKKYHIPTEIINRQQLNDQGYFNAVLDKYETNYIILAGFLLLIPHYLIQSFPNKIINIHPSLLPKYGGKGMYGMYIHNAVVAAGEKESGLTIHLVNEEYDKGEVLFQTKLAIELKTPEELASAVLELEHKFFSKIIEEYIMKSNQSLLSPQFTEQKKNNSNQK